MKRKYIKLNDNYSHLAIGNIINIIKEESKNKSSAIQSEVFCALFNLDYINESTVNNYCIGSRSIGNDYKQIMINLKKKYQNDPNIFTPILDNILTIVEGTIYDITNIKLINENTYLKNIVNNLYNISKNDFYVNKETLNKFKELLKENNYYALFIEMLFYAILEKKQPLYEDERVKNTIATLLQNTDISVNDLQDFILLELSEGISFSHSLINMASLGNPYAAYHLGIMEYRGEFTGTPRYDKAYEYFKIGEVHNHPTSCFMLGNMIINHQIGNNDYKKALEYFQKGKDLGSTAALNALGICYKNGYGVKKDLNKALSYFEEAASKNYAYAFNNLGKYYEDNNDLDKAYEYYLKSANLNESYACNKIGEFKRKQGNTKEALVYYEKALTSTYKETTPWVYYNLAKYYYLNGDLESNTLKDEDKAILYFEKSSNLISSLLELLTIYYKKGDLDKVNYYKNLIEKHPKFDINIKKDIEDKMKKIKEKITIDIPK